MKLIEEVKRILSKWMKTKGEKYKNFYWQRGYGELFSKSSWNWWWWGTLKTKQNITKKKRFKKNILAFIKKYNVEYDEKYLWIDPHLGA